MRISDWSSDVCSSYLGYFGAAQCVLLMAIMGIGINDTLQRLNGTKNVLAALVNAVSGLIFAVVADVDWRVVAIIAVGAIVGGQVGATYGRWLPTGALRAFIVLVGVVALVVFLRSEEHTSELQSLMRISYAVFCLKKKKHTIT